MASGIWNGQGLFGATSLSPEVSFSWTAQNFSETRENNERGEYRNLIAQRALGALALLSGAQARMANLLPKLGHPRVKAGSIYKSDRTIGRDWAI